MINWLGMYLGKWLEIITNATTKKICTTKKIYTKSINFRLHGGKNTNLHGGSLLTYDHVK